MAAYKDLFGALSESKLLNDIEVAIWKKAQVLIDKAGATTKEITWASEALVSPRSKADPIARYVLAQANSNLTIAQIIGAGDSNIQTVVSAAVDKLIAGGV